MARPKIMEEGKITTIMLEKGNLEQIERVRGKTSVSGYIRRLVEEQLSPSGGDQTADLKGELREAKAKLEMYERKEKAVSKEKIEAMAYIAKGLELYKNEDIKRADDPETCRRWIDARCKGSGISAGDFLNYQLSLENQAHILRDFTE